MTPYAVLLVRANDTDLTIRVKFWEFAGKYHPDRNGGVQGSEWELYNTAYQQIKTAAKRTELARLTKTLAGVCQACSGVGTVGSRILGSKIYVCDACSGEGRTRNERRNDAVPSVRT